MLLQETLKYDICTAVLDPSAEAPARFACHSFEQGDLLDYNTVYQFGKKADLLTFEIENINVPLETIDITYYRDDIDRKNFDLDIKNTEFKTNLTGKVVVIVDDVLYTGRTIRAGLDAILSKSRPAKIQLACLIDRGHRELPIRADFIGKNIPTSHSENIEVYLKETDGKEEVVIL